MLLSDILVVFSFFILPIFIIILTGRVSLFNKIGGIIIAYVIGLVIGNINILPANVAKIQDLLTTITIPLSIPLLLFSSNIRDWYRIAGKTFVALLLGLVAIVVVISAGYFIFRKPDEPDFWKVAGMLIGTYSGGTPNLATIKMMLNVDADTYIKVHVFDMVISTAFLAFFMTIGHRLISLILPSYKSPKTAVADDEALNVTEDFNDIFKRKYFVPLLGALGVAILIFAIGGGVSLLFGNSAQMLVVMLTITTLSIAASLIPKVHNTQKTFELGMYFILVFSLTVASMANLKDLLGAVSNLFYYVAFAIFGSMLLHILLSKLFKVDVDTFMITSTAMICSPPFVPMIAGAIKNREVIVSGITVGIIGYAIGNYLGVSVAEILKMF